MQILKDMFAPQAPIVPATVDEAVRDLQVSLDNLAAVSVDRRAMAADLHAQATTIAAAANVAQDEADRADRIHGKIAELLK